MKKFFLVIVLPIILFGGGLLYLTFRDTKPQQQVPVPQNGTIDTRQSSGGSPQSNTSVRWEFDGESWKAIGTAPTCPSPIKLGTPIDSDNARAIIYPGQIRNGVYKSYGGFAFDSGTENKILVKTPLDGQLVKASKYSEQGELHYRLIFINQCGIMYTFDHLLELPPRLQEIVNKLPTNKQSTEINPRIDVLGGEIIGTKVGFSRTKNVFVEFGVYDLRKKNGIVKSNDKEYAPYGICWFNNLTPQIATLLKSLPPQDKADGKQSDYCK